MLLRLYNKAIVRTILNDISTKLNETEKARFLPTIPDNIKEGLSLYTAMRVSGFFDNTNIFNSYLNIFASEKKNLSELLNLPAITEYALKAEKVEAKALSDKNKFINLNPNATNQEIENFYNNKIEELGNKKVRDLFAHGQFSINEHSFILKNTKINTDLFIEIPFDDCYKAIKQFSNDKHQYVLNNFDNLDLLLMYGEFDKLNADNQNKVIALYKKLNMFSTYTEQSNLKNKKKIKLDSSLVNKLFYEVPVEHYFLEIAHFYKNKQTKDLPMSFIEKYDYSKNIINFALYQSLLTINQNYIHSIFQTYNQKSNIGYIKNFADNLRNASTHNGFIYYDSAFQQFNFYYKDVYNDKTILDSIDALILGVKNIPILKKLNVRGDFANKKFHLAHENDVINNSVIKQ